MLDVVIFSKDRACQLDLLLRSIKSHVIGWQALNVRILFTYSRPAFGAAYDAVVAEHPEFVYVCERDEDAGFRELTLRQVGESPYVTFLVDDDVFKDAFSLDMPEFVRFTADPSIMCLSLRMCPRMDYAYTLDRHTPIPSFQEGTIWSWPGCDGDWGYPMSIDGHIFRRDEIVPLMHALEFRDPNTFEDVLSRHPLPHPNVICFAESKVINLPVNRVQQTALNRHGDVTADWLNGRFLERRRLSLATVAGVRNPSPHHELPLQWDEDAAAPAPRVSVVIPCHDAAAHLEETLASLTDQTLRHIEVIVVDDGSTDGSSELAERFAAAHPDLSMRVLHRPASGHPAHPRNAGVALARGEFVLCLDADDQLTPMFLERCVATLDAHPEASVAYTDQQDFGGSNHRHTVPEYDFRTLTRKNFLGIASVFRRRAWLDAGGFDASTSYEDWDFWIGCGEHGHYGIRVPAAEWRYRVRADGRFARDGIPNDRRTKAQLVLKRPGLYSEGQRRWARALLAGDDAAGRIPDELWVIPEVDVLAPVAAPPTPPTNGPAAPAPAAPAPPESRELPKFMAVALVDEALRHPEIVEAYSDQFRAADAATLVLFAADADPSELAGRLEPLVARVGLDQPDACEVMALAVPAADGEAALLGQAHALLTLGGDGGALARLPVIRPDAPDDLRRRAAEVWRVGPPSRVIRVGPGELEVAGGPLRAGGGGRHYERNVVECFHAAVAAQSAPVVYDIGANCGYFTVLAGGLGATTYSFEPVPTTFDVLRRNRTRNGLPADGAFCLALGADAGRVTVGEQTVAVRALDDCVERFELAPPTLIKLRVEGAERDVLLGARRTLERHHPTVILDNAKTSCAGTGDAFEELLSVLTQLGYGIWALAEDPDDLRLRPHDRLHEVPVGALIASIQAPAEPDAARRVVALGSAPSSRPAGGDRVPSDAFRDPLEAPPAAVAHRPPGWQWYVQDLAAYRAMNGGEAARDEDLMPKLEDRTPGNPYDGHYFFQDVWAARRVADRRPAEHVDVGSRVDYVGFLTAVTNVVFVDIRPLEAEIEGLRCVTGSILDLPFDDHSVESISCLHVAEHIGLGRYGDPLNPSGTIEAARELERVVAPGGQLLFAVPVGRPRTCFNAHRIFDPREVPAMFPELELVECAGVDDAIRFRRHRDPAELAGCEYGCGMYLLRRPV